MRPVLERDKLYHEVLALRTQGLSYNQIIKHIQEREGVRLGKSHLHDWITGKHRPLGSVTEFDSKPSPELAYLIGVAKGDASLGVNRWNYRIRLRVIDKDFAQAFNYCASEVLHRGLHSLMWIPSRLQWSVEICSELLYLFLKQPLTRLRITIEHCEACIALFLRGFFDSEGSISGRSLSVSNTRLVTLTTVKRLLKRLDLAVTGPHLGSRGGRLVTIKGKEYKANRNLYTLRVRARSLAKFQELIGFSIARKSRALAQANTVP